MWTIKFKTLTVSIKYNVPLLGSSALTNNVMRAVWEPHSTKNDTGHRGGLFPFPINQTGRHT